MAQYEGSYPGRQAREANTMEEVNGWAVGITFLACIMMMLVGSFHIISGLAAVLDQKFYTPPAGYAFDLDTTTWGWLHLAGGVLIMVCGGLLLTGNTVVRLITIFLLVLSIIGSFVSIPYYPVWSILIIALNFATMWAITVYGHFVQNEV